MSTSPFNLSQLANDFREKGRAHQEMVVHGKSNGVTSSNPNDAIDVDFSVKESQPQLPTAHGQRPRHVRTPRYGYSPTLPHYGCEANQSTALTKAEVAAYKQQWTVTGDKKTAAMKKDKLGTRTAFSYALNAILGTANVADVQVPDDEQVKINIFANLVELEALSSLQKGRPSTLSKILDYAKKELGFETSTSLSTLTWRCHINGAHGQGIISLGKIIFNAPRLDATATVSSILKMNFENTFTVHNVAHVAEREHFANYANNIPKYIPLQLAGNTNVVASLVEVKEVRGNAQQVIGAFCIYKASEHRFCLPATVVCGTMCLAKYKATAALLNQDRIDAHPNATIVLCQDIRMAIELDKKMLESPCIDSTNFIVSGHYGDNLSVLPWSYLAGHTIVLLCAPVAHCYAQVKEYRDFMGSSVDLHVYPFPILAYGMEKANAALRLDDSLEQLLVSHAIAIKDIAASDLRQRILAEAFTYDQYQDWARDHGFLPSKTKFVGTSCSTTKREPTLFACSDAEFNELDNGTDVALDTVFLKGTVSFLHGLKNAGKSYTALELIACFCAQKPFAKFMPPSKPSTCLLIDSETQPPMLDKKLKQLGLSEHLGGKLTVISKVQEPLDSPWANFDLLNEESINLLTGFVQKHNIDYLFLDNLTSLMREASLYHQQAPGVLDKGLKKIQSLGVAIIVVHHTGNGGDGKMRGNAEFSIRCHAEIMVIGSEEALRRKDTPDVVKTVAKQEGALTGICVKSCKSAAFFENKVFWQHLPYNQQTWRYIATSDVTGTILEDAQTSLPSASLAPDNAPEDIAPDGIAPDRIGPDCIDSDGADAQQTNDLSPREQKALDSIRKKKKAKRQEVQDHLDVSAKTAGNTLNRLIELGKIKRNGAPKSKNTFYSVV